MISDTTRLNMVTRSPFMRAVQKLFAKYGLWPEHVRFEYDWTEQKTVITWKVGNEWHKMTVGMNDASEDTLRLLEVRIKMSL